MKRSTVAGIGFALVLIAVEALIYAKATEHVAPRLRAGTVAGSGPCSSRTRLGAAGFAGRRYGV